MRYLGVFLFFFIFTKVWRNVFHLWCTMCWIWNNRNDNSFSLENRLPLLPIIPLSYSVVIEWDIKTGRTIIESTPPSYSNLQIADMSTVSNTNDQVLLVGYIWLAFGHLSRHLFSTFSLFPPLQRWLDGFLSNTTTFKINSSNFAFVLIFRGESNARVSVDTLWLKQYGLVYMQSSSKCWIVSRGS